MQDVIALTISNDLSEVARVAKQVTPYLERWGVDEATSYRIHLVLEELISNVIRHAYADGAEHVIDLDMSQDGDGVEIRIRDDGPAFDPTRAPEVDVTAPLEERQVGGLGLHLVRRSARKIDYQREQGRNDLRVRV